MKKCTKCLADKVFSDFSPRKDRNGSLNSWCKLCVRTAWSAHPIKNRIKSNRSDYHRAYKKKNATVYAAYTRARKSALLKRTPVWLSKEQLAQINEFYSLVNELQWLSESRLSVDHIIPLRGRSVSGLHVPWNLQIIPLSMNIAKGMTIQNVR